MEEASSLAREMALARPAMPAPTMRMSRGTGVGCIMIAWGWESVTAAESCFIPLAGVGEYNRILIAQPLRGDTSHTSHTGTAMVADLTVKPWFIWEGQRC